MTANRPTDIELPSGWTWERVEAERAKWNVSETMVPVAVVPGACVAWCTMNSVRAEQPSRFKVAGHIIEHARTAFGWMYVVGYTGNSYRSREDAERYALAYPVS